MASKAIAKKRTENPSSDHPSTRKIVCEKPKKPRVKATEKRTDLSVVTEICERMAKGESVNAICNGSGMPQRIAFYTMLKNSTEFQRMYNEALANRGEFYAEQIIGDAEEAKGKDAAGVNAQRLVVDTKKWMVARMLPKKYGDRVIVAGDSENPLVTKHIVDADDLLTKIKGAGK